MISLNDFISNLDNATQNFNGNAKVFAVKDVLAQAFRKGLDLPSGYYEPEDGHYARRLLHKAKDSSYSVVIMVWDVDQKTPLHDHDNRWCVECVLRGKVKITSFEHKGKESDGSEKFEAVEEILAGEGETGHLIPPYEYHVVENALPNKSSVTIHVYEEELTESTVFAPTPRGTYTRERRTLTYAKLEEISPRRAA